MAEPFIAEIRIWGCTFAPRGWSMCNGQLLPIAQNTALFSLIGTTYGGDGRTTFALPNLEGRIPMGTGRGPGLTSRRLGERTGTPVVALAETQLPSHTHTMDILLQLAQNEVNIPTSGTHLCPDSVNVTGTFSAATVNGQMNSSSISSYGGSQAHENRQPYLTMNFCMALVGLYPSRP